MKFFTLSLLALTTAGCAVGPDYRAPQPEPARIERAAAAGFDRARFEGAWWQQFEDPTLDRLVAHALAENRELRIAFARLGSARAIRDDAANDRFPTVTAGAGAEIGKAQQPGFGDRRVDIERYDLGLDMAWELDLFGRIQRRLEASEAQAEAAEADLQQLQVSLIAELVDAYGQLRGAQLRERIARANLDNQRRSRELTVQLRDGGLGSDLDVLRADARLAATEATLPQLQAQQARARNRIATLLGQRADQLSVDLSPRELPAIAKALPIGDPGELLRRRPDIRAAERQLAAATANVGVATADLFPRVSLSGFLGFIAGRGSQLGSSAAEAWSVAPGISWAAFDLGSVRAACAAPRPRPRGLWRPTSSRCCWHWRNRRMPSATTAMRSSACWHSCASPKPAVPQPSRRALLSRGQRGFSRAARRRARAPGCRRRPGAGGGRGLPRHRRAVQGAGGRLAELSPAPAKL